MIINAVKNQISSAISEKGGATVTLVKKVTIPLETSVREAKDGMYVIGSEELVRGQFQGLLRSMAEGVRRDGHSRQIGDYLTVYAQPIGEIDLDKGWDDEVNEMQLKARLLNEMEIDITSWVFNDVTVGRIPFKLENASSGATDGEIELGEAVHINGKDLPKEFRVEWTCEDKSGEVAAGKSSGDATRIDIDADQLDSLKSAAYNGKKITFKVRGNKANASVSATLKYVEIPVTLTKFYDSEHDNKIGENPRQLRIEGTGLANLTAADVSFDVAGDEWTPPASAPWNFTDSLITVGDGVTAMSSGGTSDDPFTVTVKGVSIATVIA